MKNKIIGKLLLVAILALPCHAYAQNNFEAKAYFAWDWDAINTYVSDKHLKDMIDHIKDSGYKGITFDYMMEVAPDGTVTNNKQSVRMFDYIRYSVAKGLIVDAKLHWILANCDNVNQYNIPSTFDYEKFFVGAEDFLVKSAPLMQEAKVSGFYIGTESDQFFTSKYHDRWANIIGKIRSTYKGQIYYDALYFGLIDSQKPYEVGIWDLVDKIGLSFYPALSATPINDYNRLKALFSAPEPSLIAGKVFLSWHNCAYYPQVPSIVEDLKALSAKYGKQIIFGEINPQAISNNLCGYIPTGDLVANKVPVDVDAKARYLQAINETINEKLVGVVVGANYFGYEPWESTRTKPEDPYSYWKLYDDIVGTNAEKVLMGFLKQWNPTPAPDMTVVTNTQSTTNVDVVPAVIPPAIPVGPVSNVSVLIKGIGGSVASDPIGINCGVNCSYDFPEGTIITLVATPENGKKFKNWGGACGGNKPICKVRLTKSRYVTAAFK